MKYPIIFAAIFMISFISAVAIYSGDSYELTLDKPYSYYSVVGNTTAVILNITSNGTNVIITPDKYSPSDSYDIIFYAGENVVGSSGGGGSGGSSRKKKVINNTEFYFNTSKIITPITPYGEIEITDIKNNFLIKIIIIISAILLLIGISYLIYRFRKLNNRRYKNNGKRKK